MAKTLKMVLTLSENKTTTLSLANPKEGLAKDEVLTVLGEIIEKKALTVNGMNPTAVKEVYIQNVEEQALA